MNWLKIILIYMTFELLQFSIKSIFLIIKKIVAMICFLSLSSSHKNNILYYKAVKVIINISNIGKIIFEYSFLNLIITNNSFSYFFKTCHFCAIFYALDAIFLLYFICKSMALSKNQIAASKTYSLNFQCKHFIYILS